MEASRSDSRWNAAMGYFIAVSLCVLAAGSTMILERLGIPNLFLLFLFANIASAFIGGAGPGIFCSVICTLAATFVIPNPRSFDVTNVSAAARLTLYSLATTGTTLLTLAALKARSRLLHELEDRRRAEEQVRRLNEELERRVRERTSDLDSFAYSVAHDIRGPLRTLAGMSHIVREDYSGRLDAVGRDYLSRIEGAAHRLDALTLDLLTHSQVGRQDIVLQGIALDELVRKIVEEMAPDIQERRARVEVAGPLPPVTGHPFMLTLAIRNLLSNAIKFVVPGQLPQVRIASEEDGEGIRLTVQDHGIGIPPEYQRYIFGVFHRLHKIEEYPGTGMGLAIVEKAMSRMGGSVGVTSEPGRGSLFWLRLRRAAAAEPIPGESRPPLQGEGEAA